MGWIFNLLLLTAMIVGAIVTYDMKHDAEVAAADVARLQAEMAKEKDRITLLRAEWSMLTQPGRLQSVVEEYADHFQLQPFVPDQIGTMEEIPLRPTDASDEDGRPLATAAVKVTNAIRLAAP